MKTKAVFTYPESSDENHIQFMTTLVEKAQDGSKIRVVISHFSTSSQLKPLVNAIKNAPARNVDVQCILRTPGCDDVISEFEGAGISHLKTKGCFGSRIHTKLLLASNTQYDNQPWESVAVIGSATWTGSSLNKQNEIIAVSDGVLFDQMITYWDEMYKNGSAPSSTKPMQSNKRFESSDSKVKCYTFPQILQKDNKKEPWKDDVVYRIIGNLKSTVHPTSGKRPSIKIAMARWNDGRKYLLDVIKEKLSAKVNIEILYRKGLGGTVSTIIEDLRDLKEKYPNLKLFAGKVGGGKSDVHAKYFMLDGVYNEGEQWESNVWIGSHNWTDNALRSNDEMIFKVRIPSVYEAFLANFKKIKKALKEVE